MAAALNQRLAPERHRGQLMLAPFEMRILTTASQKGGSAKTTTAVNLFVCSEKAGLKTLIVDIDPQGSALSWAKRRARNACTEPTTIAAACSPDDLDAMIARLAAEGYEFVLIDTPGTTGAAVDPALAACDYALVTCAPTIDDLDAVLPTARALHRFGKQFAYVLTSCPLGERRASEAEEILDRLVARAGNRIYRRVAYQDASARGLGVIEMGRDQRAAQEMNVLWEWVRARLSLRDAS